MPLELFFCFWAAIVIVTTLFSVFAHFLCLLFRRNYQHHEAATTHERTDCENRRNEEKLQRHARTVETLRRNRFVDEQGSQDSEVLDSMRNTYACQKR